MQGASQGPAEPQTGEQANVESTGANRPTAEQAHSEPQSKDMDDVQIARPASQAGRQAESEHEARGQADTEMTAAAWPTACQQPPRRLETHVWHAKRMKMVPRCA